MNIENNYDIIKKKRGGLYNEEENFMEKYFSGYLYSIK